MRAQNALASTPIRTRSPFLPIAGGVVLAIAVWRLAESLVQGLLGFLLVKLSIAGIDLGQITATAVAATLSLLSIHFLMKKSESSDENAEDPDENS